MLQLFYSYSAKGYLFRNTDDNLSHNTAFGKKGVGNVTSSYVIVEAESGYTIYRYVLTDGRIVNIKYRTNDIYDLNGVVDCVLIEGEPVIS